MNLSTQLRAILLIVGVALLVVIYFLGRRKSSGAQRHLAARAVEPEVHAQRFEMTHDDGDDEPHVLYDEPVHLGIDDHHQAAADRVDLTTRVDEETQSPVDFPPMYAEPEAAAIDAWDATAAHTVSAFDGTHQEPEPLIKEPQWTIDPAPATPSPRSEPSFAAEAIDHDYAAAPHEPALPSTEPVMPAKPAVHDVPTMDESLATAPYRARKPSAPAGNTAPTLSEAITPPAGRRYESPVSSPRATTNTPAGSKGNAKPASRKIVALRLAVGTERISGQQLLQVFASENLQHGKFNIFHRLHDGGSIFSVASMVEPGSFEPAHMDEQQFPGVTMFTLLPGPIDGVCAFDQMVACAQAMAQLLNAVLQDERGVKLLPHNIERMREEVLDFQHLVGGVSASA